jgi:hypothetical protein
VHKKGSAPFRKTRHWTPSRRLGKNFVRDLTCNFRLTFLNCYIWTLMDQIFIVVDHESEFASY